MLYTEQSRGHRFALQQYRGGEKKTRPRHRGRVFESGSAGECSQNESHILQHKYTAFMGYEMI